MVQIIIDYQFYLPDIESEHMPMEDFPPVNGSSLIGDLEDSHLVLIRAKISMSFIRH
jgi:hypothetical protein